MKIANSMLDLIGDIPLVRLNRVGKDTGCEILVKPEFLNPSGSIKDRMVKYMIEAAEKSGKIKPGTTEIVEASTGNTAAALAFISAVKGYKLSIYLPLKVANPHRTAISKAYAPNVVEVDTDAVGKERAAKDGSIHGAEIETYPRDICRTREKENKNVWWSRQFSNPENTAAHRDWTGREILEQTDGKMDAFVASVGTGGTLLGIGQALHKHNLKIRIIGVEPASSPIIAGKKENYKAIDGITGGILTEIFDCDFIDKVYCITDQEAIAMAHQLAEKEGIFCGMSSGANVAACLKLAQEIGRGKRIVTVLPDSRDRYLAVEQYTT